MGGPAGGDRWRMRYSVWILAGIGFTMSLFIGWLAFEQGKITFFDERLGIIFGSLLSGVVGYLWLRKVLPRTGGDSG
jgi:NhaA family Na+:H+ antiporter